ncbi:hypothetical protein HK096_004167, partial [Nowakowskiella sp. JEL0078]
FNVALPEYGNGDDDKVHVVSLLQIGKSSRIFSLFFHHSKKQPRWHVLKVSSLSTVVPL